MASLSPDHAPQQLLLLPLDMISRPPSLSDGISSATEHCYRIWGCELVQDMGIMLRLRQVVMATAQTLLQRFYYRKSLAAYDAHIVAMAALFLAAKVEEQPRRMRDVINVCYHAKLRRQGKASKPIVLGGNLYAVWKGALIRTERVILKELGFSVYNLTQHPHKFILNYVRTLVAPGQDAAALAQTAWAYLNDSLRLDLCVRYSAESIACASIYLAARSTGFALPKSVPWHAVFNTSRAEMHDIAEEMLTLYDSSGSDSAGSGGCDGVAAAQSSSSANASSSTSAMDAGPRLESPTMHRGPGRPLRWLPSLRPDAQPGDDEDEGEGPPLTTPSSAAAAAAAAGGVGLATPLVAHGNVIVSSADVDMTDVTAGSSSSSNSSSASVLPAGITEIVAAAAAAAAAKAAALTSSSSSASAMASAASTGPMPPPAPAGVDAVASAASGSSASRSASSSVTSGAGSGHPHHHGHGHGHHRSRDHDSVHRNDDGGGGDEQHRRSSRRHGHGGGGGGGGDSDDVPAPADSSSRRRSRWRSRSRSPAGS